MNVEGKLNQVMSDIHERKMELARVKQEIKDFDRVAHMDRINLQSEGCVIPKVLDKDVIWKEEFKDMENTSPQSSLWVDTSMGELSLYPENMRKVDVSDLRFEVLSPHSLRNEYGEVTEDFFIQTEHGFKDILEVLIEGKLEQEVNLIRLETISQGIEAILSIGGKRIVRKGGKLQWRLDEPFKGEFSIVLKQHIPDWEYNEKKQSSIYMYNLMFLDVRYGRGRYESFSFLLPTENVILEVKEDVSKDLSVNYQIGVAGKWNNIEKGKPWSARTIGREKQVFNNNDLYVETFEGQLVREGQLIAEPLQDSVNLRVGYQQWMYGWHPRMTMGEFINYTKRDEDAHVYKSINEEGVLEFDLGGQGAFSIKTYIMSDKKHDIVWPVERKGGGSVGGEMMALVNGDMVYPLGSDFLITLQEGWNEIEILFLPTPTEGTFLVQLNMGDRPYEFFARRNKLRRINIRDWDHEETAYAINKDRIYIIFPFVGGINMDPPIYYCDYLPIEQEPIFASIAVEMRSRGAKTPAVSELVLRKGDV